MGKMVSFASHSMALSTICWRLSAWKQSSTVMAMIFSSVSALENTGMKPSAVGVGRVSARWAASADASGSGVGTGSGVGVWGSASISGSASTTGAAVSSGVAAGATASTELSGWPPLGMSSTTSSTTTNAASAPPPMISRLRSMARRLARETMGLL